MSKPDLGRLAGDLAEQANQTTTTVVVRAVQERMDRLRNQRFDAIESRLRNLQPLFSKVPASWEIDELLYDENGLPK